MMDARARVLDLINGAWTTQAIGVACELGLPDRLASGPRRCAELAHATSTEAAALERLLRALATLELVIENDDGSFVLAPAAQVLRSDREDSVAAWARLGRGRLWANWAELGESVRTGRSARTRRDGPDDFTPLNADADGADAFNAAMTSITRPVARAAAAALDWSTTSVVVDVGGGPGDLAVSLLRAHPHLRGIVLDLEHASNAARKTLAEGGVADRCEFVRGSFFDAIPAGDALVLKSVLHNWDDERAARILARCADAVRKEGRVILLERVVPVKLGTGSADREAMRSDLNMLVGCGGRERTLPHFERMLAAAQLRLHATRPLAAGFHALEAVRG